MARHDEAVRTRVPRQSSGELRARQPQRSAQPDRCPGAAAQLAAVHRVLRHGPALQLEAAGRGAPAAGPSRAAGANRTGLPDRLKTGVEALSGVSLDEVKVHYNSSRPAELGALAYARGTDIHLAPGQEDHLPHEAWHVVQQAQGRVRPTRQLKEGVPLNDDSGLEREADAMGARALREAPAPGASFAVGTDLGMRDRAAQPAQLWALDEDDKANALLAKLDGVEKSADALMTRAGTLSTRVPATLRAHWIGGAGGRIPLYQQASDLRKKARDALNASRPTRLLKDVRDDATSLSAELPALWTGIRQAEAVHDKHEAAVKAQDKRRELIAKTLAQPEGAAKLKEWQDLATALQAMDDAAIGKALAAFGADPGNSLFTKEQVADVRNPPKENATKQEKDAATTRKEAVIEYLTYLFSTGKAKLDTWGKFYPTAFDLKTGEFGGEWHVKSGEAKWLNGIWVFHSHCEGIRDAKSGAYEGFRFKPELGANHLKMATEKMAAGVQLDLPLSEAALDAMAAPYQQQFHDRLDKDAQFGSVLKKSRG